MPEYLDDDVPTNVDYLADALKQSTMPPKARRTKKGSGAEGFIISDIDGETIKMLDPAGLRILDGFLAEPRVDDTDGDAGRCVPVV